MRGNIGSDEFRDTYSCVFDKHALITFQNTHTFCRDCFSRQERHRGHIPPAALSSSALESLLSAVFTHSFKLHFSETKLPIVT